MFHYQPNTRPNNGTSTTHMYQASTSSAQLQFLSLSFRALKSHSTPATTHSLLQLLRPTHQYNKVIYFFCRSFYTPKRSFGLSRLLLTLLILSFLPLHPSPCLIAQLYRCRHRLPLLLKHELLGKLNSSGSWTERCAGDT